MVVGGRRGRVSGVEVRRALIASVADLIPEPPRPLLIAIDGVDGAGKTTFANELADELQVRGLVVERASIDDFHHPREHRHRHGRTAEAIWSRHFDYRSLRRELVDPWLAGSGSAYRSTWHDVRRDEYVVCEPRVVPHGGVLVVDGLFAQRTELANAWDFVVFLDVPFDVSVARLAVRDGTPDDPEHPEHLRYVAAQRHYFDRCSPLAQADLVIDNTDVSAPAVADGQSLGGTPPGWHVDGDELVRTIRLPRERADIAAAIDRLLL
jgi:uridine kinase